MGRAWQQAILVILCVLGFCLFVYDRAEESGAGSGYSNPADTAVARLAHGLPSRLHDTAVVAAHGAAPTGPVAHAVRAGGSAGPRTLRALRRLRSGPRAAAEPRPVEPLVSNASRRLGCKWVAWKHKVRVSAALRMIGTAKCWASF